MSKLKILVAGDPVLRQKAAEVERMDKKTLRLLDDMAEKFRKQGCMLFR